MTLYAYEDGVRIVGVIAGLADLDPSDRWGGPATEQAVRDWALDATNDLPLGYLDLHRRDGLVFGVHVLHGDLALDARRRLVEEFAWRADSWEAALTGADVN